MPKEVSFIIRLDDKGTFKKVTVDAEELGKAVHNVQDEAQNVRRAVIKWAEVSQAFDVMQNAISELQGVMTDLTSAYQVQLVAETQLETIMRQRMGATDDMIQSVKDLCSAQQELGVIGDEVQLSGAQQMATFLKSKESLDVLIPAMNNLVAQQNGLNATNQDAVSIGNMMGKAMQGQVEVLQRVGITFDESQKKVLQFGNESERAAMLAQVITDNVGNMNQELAKTDAGKQKQLENTLGDIKEEMGQVMQKYSQLITTLSQITIVVGGFTRLYTTLRSISAAFRLGTIATAAYNAASVRLAALTQTCSATMRGATVSATTLKLAIQGLWASTGVGIAVVALTEVLSKFIIGCDNAAASATNMSNAEKSAFDNIQQAYDSTLKQTYANLIAKYEQMQTSWKSMRTEHEKTQWVKNNKAAFEELGLKINSIAEAENAFTKNTEKVKEAFEKRAQAAAYAAELVELYKQQLDLKNRKQNVDSTLKAARDKYNHSTSVDNQDNPYASQTTNRLSNLSAIASDMRRGGDGNLTKLNQDLNTVNKKIAETKASLQEIGNVSTMDVDSSGGGSTGGKGGHTTSTTTTTNNDTPLQGSIDWYEKAIGEKRKEMESTAIDTTRRQLQGEIEGLERELGMIKIKAGIEPVPPIEVKKETKGIIDQIDEQLDEWLASLGGEPIVVGLEANIKQRDLERIQSLFSIDTSNFESVRSALENIRGITSSTSKGLAIAGASCESLGSAMQQLGADSAAAKAGLVMAAIGQIALSFAQALNSASSNWVTWLAFGIAGTAQMVSMIATISKFATGGIVGGNQRSGDNVLVRVNSGEMILNAAQQARLFAIANGAAVYGAAQVGSDFSMGAAVPVVSLQSDRLQGILGGGDEKRKLSIDLKLKGRDIVAAVANETRSNRRRSNIR